LGHVLLHGQREIFIEGDFEDAETGDQEMQADTFACNQLIPERSKPELPALRKLDAISAFAARVGVSPGIVVGRLQHDRLIGFTVGNGLKVGYTFNL